jgi:hypothetical protein
MNTLCGATGGIRRALLMIAVVAGPIFCVGSPRVRAAGFTEGEIIETVANDCASTGRSQLQLFNSLSSAFASLRASVSNPSVNQL